MAAGQPSQYEAGSEVTLVTTEGLARGVPVKQTIHVGRILSLNLSISDLISSLVVQLTGSGLPGH